MHLRRHILLGAALTAIAAGSALASPNHPGRDGRSAALAAPHSTLSPRIAALVAWKPRAWAPATLAAAQSQGMRVAIDPVDGTMGMPAPDQLSNGVVIGDEDNTPVQVDRAADGTLTAHLDDRWADFAMATIGADGKPDWTCVQGRQGAARYMKQPVVRVIPATPKWEDK